MDKWLEYVCVNKRVFEVTGQWGGHVKKML